jgi:hypothetical protein
MQKFNKLTIGQQLLIAILICGSFLVLAEIFLK